MAFSTQFYANIKRTKKWNDEQMLRGAGIFLNDEEQNTHW